MAASLVILLGLCKVFSGSDLYENDANECLFSIQLVQPTAEQAPMTTFQYFTFADFVSFSLPWLASMFWTHWRFHESRDWLDQ